MPAPAPHLVVCADPGAAAAAAAELLDGWVRTCVSRRGHCTVAVSGGSTPVSMFAELAARRPDWAAVELFQVDERVAPAGTALRNATALHETLVDPLGLDPSAVHLMDVEAADLEKSARRYGRELFAVGALDVVHLGLGTDGHTASWPPGELIPDDRDVAVTGPFNGTRRMTLTPRAVARAGSVLWLVAGSDKAGALARLWHGDPAVPASRVPRAGATIVCDAAAAAQLDSTISGGAPCSSA